MDDNQKISAVIIGIIFSLFIALAVFIWQTPKETQKWVDKRTVDTIQQNGHQYLVFKFDRSYGESVVHDPDCPREIQVEKP